MNNRSICAAAGLLIVLTATSATAGTRHVPSEYPTIQAALDAATSGDTVLVAPGTYSDTLTAFVNGNPKTVNAHITKAVYLFAEDPAQMPHIDGSASDIAVYVDNATCEISGFEITTTLEGFGCVLGETTSFETSQLLEDDIGVRCDNGAVRISDCRIHDHLHGVELNSAAGTIERCEIYRSPVGVRCVGSPLATIVDSDFRTCGGMIDAEESIVHIEGNRFSREEGFACTAIVLDLSEGTVVNNVIESLMVEGIVLGASTVLVESNTIRNCKLGMVMTFGDSVVVRRNLFQGNSPSIDIRATRGCTIENNIFTDGGTAMICQSFTADPLIQNNIFYTHYVGIACINNPIPTIRCNDFFNTPDPFYGDCEDKIGIDGNFSLEPQFCAPANGDFTLQPDSPCAPGNHPDGIDCGLIGAYGVSCDDVPTARTSWGRLKSLYQGGPDKD